MGGAHARVSQRHWAGKTDGGHRHASEAWLQRYADELLAILRPDGGTLLDVGCGSCQLTTYLAPAFKRVYAVDFSETMREAARQRVAACGARNIEVLAGDMQAFPTEVRQADAVLSYGVLQYLGRSDVGTHLAECRRILAPAGVVCIANIPNAWRRSWYQRAILAPQPGGRLGPARQWLAVSRMRIAGWLRNDTLWDSIGSWFSPSDIAAAAEAGGFDTEILNAWHYDYRFHAVLTPKGRAGAPR